MSHFQVQRKEINTPKCDRVVTFTHGFKRSTETAIMTIHDLGCSHTQYLKLLKEKSMEDIAKRFYWLHIQLPGQRENDPDLSNEYKFPSLQDIADDLICILDQLEIKNVVLFGQGAGANILARFAMAHNNRVLGAILVDVVAYSASFFARTNRRLSHSMVSDQGMNAWEEEYLIKHRFGSVKENAPKELRDAVDEFQSLLNHSMNAKNVNAYVDSYVSRSGIKEKFPEIRCPVLFLTGSHSPHKSDTVELYQIMQRALLNEPKRRSEVDLLQISEATNVLIEKPEKVAECMQYFLQGLGLGGSLTIRRLSNSSTSERRTRSLSMAEYDQPRGTLFYAPESTWDHQKPDAII